MKDNARHVTGSTRGRQPPLMSIRIDSRLIKDRSKWTDSIALPLTLALDQHPHLASPQRSPLPRREG